MALGTGIIESFGTKIPKGTKQTLVQLTRAGNLSAGFDTAAIDIGGANRVCVFCRYTHNAATKVTMIASVKHPSDSNWHILQVPNGGPSDIIDASWDKAVSASKKWVMGISPVTGDQLKLSFSATGANANDLMDVDAVVSMDY